MKKSKVEWLSRNLIPSPYHYALCLTEQQYHGELKRIGIPERLWDNFVDKDAAAHFLSGDGGTLLAIVTLNQRKGRSLEQVYGLLVHEAVHIWQAIKDELGEKIPGAEQEAYSVQAIAQSLMESYRDQTASSKKAKNKAKA